MLLGKNFDDLDGVAIQSLADNGAPESVNLEFKRESYGRSDSDKKELLKDISALANTLGGHIVIGIDEEGGAATSIVPLAEVGVDQELQRLESIARTGIEPTVIGLRMRRIDVNDGCVILIQVPRSFNPPHRVILKNSNRYYARNSTEAHELSLEELRRLFGHQRSIEERAKTFIGQRFLSIQANDGAMPLPIPDGVLVMHLIPLPDFGAERRIEIADLHAHRQSFVPIAADDYSWRINLDGYCMHQSGEMCRAYTQIFRNGSVEATTATVFHERDGERQFSAVALPKFLIRTLTQYTKGLQALNASPPFMLQISAMAVHGVSVGVNRGSYVRHHPPYSREVLHLPPTMITEYADDGHYAPVIGQQMDFLWNAFGCERCSYFDNEGNWLGS